MDDGEDGRGRDDDATDGTSDEGDATAVASVDDVPEVGTYLFTVAEPGGREEEVLLVRTDDGGIAAWKNFCMHEPDQRLDVRGRGAATRDGRLICPRHGSMFDAATGDCDNGPAAGQSLVDVDVAVRDGTVYLTAEHLTYRHEGPIDRDDGPSSTSHLSF
jgi:nitrite reductase/ring-hydroxylating ferredoxin subunit